MRRNALARTRSLFESSRSRPRCKLCRLQRVRLRYDSSKKFDALKRKLREAPLSPPPPVKPGELVCLYEQAPRRDLLYVCFTPLRMPWIIVIVLVL